MKQQPAWYTDEIDRHTALIADGEESYEQAITSLRMLIRDEHREFGNAILDRFNGAYLKLNVAAAGHQAEADPDFERHMTLFPALPFRSLKVTPARYRPIPQMTGHDLDMAKNILMAKTQNSIDGSEAERHKFLAFYDKIRPMLRGAMTVAEAESRLVASHEPASK